MKKIFIILICGFYVIYLNSQTKLWVGGNGVWNDANNWDPVGIPLSSDSVSITIANTITIPSTFNAVSKALYLKNGADLVIETSATLFINGALEDGLQLIGNGTTLSNSGIIKIGNNSTIYRNGILLLNGSQITNNSSGIIEIDNITFNIGLAMSSFFLQPSSSFNNNGTLKIGKYQTINQCALFIQNSQFTNNSSGIIEIDNINTTKGIENDGDKNYNSFFINSGQILIPNDGILLRDTFLFQNNTGGTITVKGISLIDSSHFINTNSITNLGGISISNKSNFKNQGGATITTTGSIYIDESTNKNNRCKLVNEGNITVNASWNYGFYIKGGLLMNNTGGNIFINNVTSCSCMNQFGGITLSAYVSAGIDGQVENNGTIKIGNSSAIAESGIILLELTVFNNNIGGYLEINNISSKEAINLYGNVSQDNTQFNNYGTIKIGNSTSIQTRGINSYTSKFSNYSTGVIEIDNINSSSGNVIYLEKSNFQNEGSIKLGKLSNIKNGLAVISSQFTNYSNAVLEVDRVNIYGGAAIQVSYDAFYSQSIFNNSGTIKIGESTGISSYGIYQTGSTFINESTGLIEINNVILSGISGKAILVGGSNFSSNFTNNGLIKLGNLGNITLAGLDISGNLATFINNSVIEIDRILTDGYGLQIGGNCSITNNGTLKMGNLNSTICPIYGFTGTTPIVNTGSINLGNVSNNRAITNTGIIQINSGRTFYNNGTVTNNSGAFLKGLGNVYYGNINFNSGSTIAPGLSPGKLTIATDFNLGNSTYQCEINGTIQYSQYDVLAINGAATVNNSTLEIIWGFTPVAGNTFTILTCNSLIGQFQNIIIPPVNGINFTVTYNATNIIITSNPLPIEIDKFIAKKKGDIISLEWTTESESNNKGFNILKSKNGENWDNIGFVNGSNNSSNKKYYSFDDLYPFLGNNYYKLEQIDFEAKTSYSDIVEINMENTYIDNDWVNINSIVLDNLIISINTKNKVDIKLQIIDIQGKIIQNYSSQESNFQLPLKELSSGFYLLNIVNGIKQKTMKFHKI